MAARARAWSLRSISVFRLALALSALPVFAAEPPAAAPGIMPMPAAVQITGGRLPLTSSFAIAVRGANEPRLRQAIDRVRLALERRTGLVLSRSGDSAASSSPASLLLDCAAAGAAIPVLGEDESYTLAISPDGALLRAATTTGALRGLATLLQLPEADGTGWFFPALRIRDEPRFPWRGMLIDVSRHWLPLAVLERQVDGMALVKLNVLHLHLSDDQGFRIESKRFPRLQEAGSDGLFYRQDEIRELVAFASARGIRVVPEFDVPGHATSWLVAYPELASAPGPYAIERHWGVFDPVFDPTNEKTYDLLGGFFGEMAALFPDEYIHVGGDENNGRQWGANPRIQAFIRAHDLKDNSGLHAYFNRRLQAIISGHGKKMIGWDEILHPDLPSGTVVDVWHGWEALPTAVRAGFPVVLSHGYYLNHQRSAADYYDNEPLSSIATLPAADQRRVIGGEVSIWSEWTDAAIVDARVWPRAAAIAERLWSPRSTIDDADMYRRLEIVSRRLEEAGLQHEKIHGAQLRALAGDSASAREGDALASLVAALRPLKPADRLKDFEPDASQFTPLTGLADCVRPDSATVRNAAAQTEAFLFGPAPGAGEAADFLRAQFGQWRDSGRSVEATLAVRSPALAAAQPLARALAEASVIGLEAIDAIASGHTYSEEACDRAMAALNRAAVPHVASELAMLAPIRLLVAGASIPRLELAPRDWRERVEKNASGSLTSLGAKPSH